MRKPQSFYEWVKLAAAVGTAYQIADTYRVKAQTWHRDRLNAALYSISFDREENEWLYYKLTRWALAQKTEVGKSLVVSQHDNHLVEAVSEDDTTLTLNFNGCPIKIWWHEVGGSGADMSGMMLYLKKPSQYMTVVFPDETTREAFIKWVEATYLTSERVNRVYRSGRLGGWRYVRTLNRRNPESLFLPSGMYDDMVSDLERFMSNHDQYIDKGIPYHRGLLLYGSPGTGKSSTICTLASAFDKNVYFLSVSELASNSALIDCVSDMPSGNFLVLEDVDIVKSSHERDGSDDGVTLDGLLNVIDGVLTPEGLITFMTTNELETLDSALIRPGRADRKFELGFLDQEQLNRMVGRFVGEGFSERILLERANVTPAEITECLKSSFDHPPEYIAACIREVVSDGYVPPTKARRISFDMGRDNVEEEDAPVVG